MLLRTLQLRGLRFGVSRGSNRQLALAYYRSGGTRYDPNTRLASNVHVVLHF